MSEGEGGLMHLVIGLQFEPESRFKHGEFTSLLHYNNLMLMDNITFVSNHSFL